MNDNKSVYFVTGAAGFIGSGICQALAKESSIKQIIAIDNINSYYSQKIKLYRKKLLLKNNKILFFKESILNKHGLAKILKIYRPTHVIHAAAQVGVRNGETNPHDYFDTNIAGTETLLSLLTPKLEHLMVFSSSSVYGSTKKLPHSESEPLTSTTPISIYGASKLAMETVVNGYFQKTNIPTTILRPFSIYGPNGRPDMLPMKLLFAAKTKKQLTLFAPNKTYRDWTYIDDCIDTILLLLQKPRGIQIVNIGNGNPISIQNTVDIAREILTKRGYGLTTNQKPANTEELSYTWADTKKLHALTKHKPATNFQTGFAKTADFFFSHWDLYSDQ